MPLSKQRNRDRMRAIRLHTKRTTGSVQPTVLTLANLDAAIEAVREGGSDPMYQEPQLDGTPWVDDIAEFVDSASEDSGTCIDGDEYSIDADGNVMPDYW